MKSTLMVIFALTVSACVAVVPVPIPVISSAPAQISVGAVSQAPIRRADGFTAMFNELRRDQGVGQVQQSVPLTHAAQAHAEDMAARGYFSHSSPGGPNGDTMTARARSAGCAMRAGAENIAQGQRSETQVLTDWANSPGHRRNLLGPNYTLYGLGRAGDNWVMVLASGC